jgi:putative intracellular protease/amidase
VNDGQTPLKEKLMKRHLTRTIRFILTIGLVILTVVGLAVAGAVRSSSQSHLPTTSRRSDDAPPVRPSSAGKHVVAVALGASGTIGSDALAPYDVFASSPDFSVYMVAASDAPAPVDGAPAIVPTFTFDDVASGRAEQPDVVVVPAVDDPDGPKEEALRDWVIEQSHDGARILGVCAGARLLAATGLLDGLDATSHWSRLDALEEQHPDVRWVAGRRFVTDGQITTTAGITSGIPAALSLVDELAGTAEASRVGRLVDYPDWSPGASTKIPVQSFSLGDLPVGLNVTVPWFRPTLGMALEDGVSEIDVASAFEVYGVSYAARTVAVAEDDTVTTEHGVVLMTLPAQEATHLDRVVVPGALDEDDIDPWVTGWAKEQELPVDPMHGPSGKLGFDGALEYLSATAGRDTAVSAAKMIDYPTADLDLRDHVLGPVGLRMPLLVLVGMLIAVGVGCVPTIVRRRSLMKRQGR